MKKHLYCLTCLFFLPLLSCQKEDEQDFTKKIQGVWNWEKSIGGFGGWTLTPKTENYSKTLYIGTNTIKEFKDNKLLYTTNSILEKNKDTITQNCNYYLNTFNGPPFQSIRIDDQYLIFTDGWGDGYCYYYRRKFN